MVLTIQPQTNLLVNVSAAHPLLSLLLSSLPPGTVLVRLGGGFCGCVGWRGHLVVVHDLPLALPHEYVLLVVDLDHALHRQEGQSAQQRPPQLALHA